MARKSLWPFLAADPEKPVPDAQRALDDLDVQSSKSGAVLGRPDLEHGAYGMVKEKAGGETPSRDERAIRGLGNNPMPIDKQ